MPSVSLVARVIARDGRLELTDRQTKYCSPPTHARRGLITEFRERDGSARTRSTAFYSMVKMWPGTTQTHNR